MASESTPRLIILGGLPGTGKSTIARDLARHIAALHLRIDTIENALRQSRLDPVADEGYRIAYVVAQDNLRIGHTVVADSVNPIAVTREAWRDIARRNGVLYVEVEVVCSDAEEHRRRVETRVPDIEGHTQPTWQQVVDREYEPWKPGLVVDTARLSVEACVTAIRQVLEAR